MKKKENYDKKDKSTQYNTMKTVISDLKKEIYFLLAQKKMLFVMMMIIMITLYILEKILILEMTPKENLTILN